MSDTQDPRQELRANLERYVAGLATSGDNFRVAGEIEPVGQEVRDDYVNSILHLFDRYADQRVAEAVRLPYRERAQLVAVLSRLYPSHTCTDDNEPDWMVVCIHVPVEVMDVYGDARNYVPLKQQSHIEIRQCGWHISTTDRDLFKHLSSAPNHYDGHTTEQKYQRLLALHQQQTNSQLRREGGDDVASSM